MILQGTIMVKTDGFSVELEWCAIGLGDIDTKVYKNVYLLC